MAEQMQHTPWPWRLHPCIPVTIESEDPYGHGPMRVADMRGWGHLTGIGTCNFDNELAFAIQCANARRIVACVNACEGIPTEALEAGVIRDLIDAATRYLRVMTRDTDDDPNCWAEEEFAEARLREVLAKVRGEAW